MLQLSWVKCQSGNWCQFQTVNLDSVDTEGVYMIWYDGDPGCGEFAVVTTPMDDEA